MLPLRRYNPVQSDAMRTQNVLYSLFLGVGLMMVVAGCATQQRDWMKVGQSYTVEEFRRDYAACTKNGKLDEDCMRGRGWVDVTPKPEPPRPQGPTYGPSQPSTPRR